MPLPQPDACRRPVTVARTAAERKGDLSRACCETTARMRGEPREHGWTGCSRRASRASPWRVGAPDRCSVGPHQHGDRGRNYHGRVGRYREFAPPIGLRRAVACLWENDQSGTEEQRVIPDGCVDLVWMDRDLFVVGADTGPVVYSPMPGGEPISGIRLRPGAAGAVLGLPASEVRDRRVPAAAIWPEFAAAAREGLAAADPAGRLDLLARSVLQRRGEPDGLVAAAARRLAAPTAKVGSVAAELGVSERHLHRRTVAAIGYGPKTLARVARVRRLVALSAPSAAQPLAERAVLAGYSSQAHMSDEVRRLTGLAPVRFLEDAALTTA